MFGGENVKCPSCGQENSDTAKFCKNCGAKLGLSSSQSSSEPEQKIDNSQTVSKPEPKNNKNLLIICATAIICVIILAGAYVALSSSGSSGNSLTSNSVAGVDNSGSGSSDYYQYDFYGYTFNIPSDYKYLSEEYDAETQSHRIGFENSDEDMIYISVINDVPNLNEDTARNLAGKSNGNLVLSDETFANVNGWGGDFDDSGISGHMFGFYSGDDIIIIGATDADLNKILSSIDQKALPSGSSSTTTETMTYSEAASYLSGASNTVIQNTFDEADANGDGVLTGSEISKFKKLADLTERTADTSNTENVEAQDYGAGDGTTKTRYCTTHGRVAVGDDNLCPYCLEEGLDARTVKGSTEYV